MARRARGQRRLVTDPRQAGVRLLALSSGRSACGAGLAMDAQLVRALPPIARPRAALDWGLIVAAGSSGAAALGSPGHLATARASPPMAQSRSPRSAQAMSTSPRPDLPDEPAAGANRRFPNVLLLPSWLPRNRDGGYDRIGHPAWFAPIHAGSGQTGLLARLADAFASRGVASLRADPRGCAASPGTWQEVTLFAKIDDARDTLAAMRGRAELDLRRTGIVGHGEGAGIALAVAIGDPVVSALTLIGPAARSFRDTLRHAAAARGDGSEHEHPIVARSTAERELIEVPSERADLTVWLAVAASDPGPRAVRASDPRPLLPRPAMPHRSVALVHGGWIRSDPEESTSPGGSPVEAATSWRRA